MISSFLLICSNFFFSSFSKGSLTEDEILKLYLAKFERNGSIDGILTREEFTDYYAGVRLV